MKPSLTTHVLGEKTRPIIYKKNGKMNSLISVLKEKYKLSAEIRYRYHVCSTYEKKKMSSLNSV